MKFMIMMNTPQGKTGEYEHHGMTKAEFAAHMEAMFAINRELEAANEMVTVLGLTPPSQASVVRAKKYDRATVTDGPFPETKEFLAGFWIVNVRSRERALEIAAKVSATPGPGGRPLEMPVEVREVLGG